MQIHTRRSESIELEDSVREEEEAILADLRVVLTGRMAFGKKE